MLALACLDPGKLIKIGDLARNLHRKIADIEPRNFLNAALACQDRPTEREEYHLTPHETRLLKLFVQGHNYKTAAARLGVAPTTINFHLQNIYQKLQVHSKTEAVAKALRNRLI